jgi:hypothetical protein
MNGDFFELLGGIAETLGLGDAVKTAFRGADTYASGRSTQTDATGDAVETPYVYERLLTRRREPGINDR